MKPTDITARRHPDCLRCVDGWICEQHPETSWPHGECAGPGRPCDAPGCVQEKLDREGRFGGLGTPATQPAHAGTLRRILWRMRARRVVTAALYSHPLGTELRVFFEPESAGDLLHSHLERFDVTALQEKAALMREALREKGWLDLPPGSAPFS